MESFIMSWKTFRASIMVRLSVARSFRSAGDKKKLLRRIRQEEIKREREREIVWKSAPLPLAASGHVPYLTQLITVSSATTKVKFSICGREKCRRREKPRRESQITWTFQRKRKPIFL